MTQSADHDAYIAKAPEEMRPLLVKLGKQLAKTLPNAEKVIGCNMPGVRVGKSNRGLCGVHEAMWALGFSGRDQGAHR